MGNCDGVWSVFETWNNLPVLSVRVYTRECTSRIAQHCASEDSFCRYSDAAIP
jgi:hypothetical protein